MITDCMLHHANFIWIPISLCEFALFLLFVRHLNRTDTHPVAQITRCCAAFAAWLAVHYAHLDFAFDYCLNVAVLAVYLLFDRSTRLQQALYVSCVFVLCTEVGKILCVDFCMQPAYSFFSQLPPWAITVIWATLSQGIALVTMLVVSRWTFSPGTERLTWKQSLAILLPLAPYILVRNSSYMYDTSNYGLYLDTVFVSVLLSVSTIVVIVTNAHNLSSQIERNELLRMQSLLREQHAQYLAHKEATQEIRRQYHDMKHYVAELEAIQESLRSQSLCETAREDHCRELDHFTARLKEGLEAYDSTIETGNEILDILLSEKRRDCLHRGIRPAFYADAHDLGFVSSFDLCAIFGNLLDNAIEAVERILSHGPKDHAIDHEIGLDIRSSRGLVVIRCTNPFDGKLHRTADSLQSTKENAEDHGVGLKSVRHTVERYGGTLTWNADGALFAVTVIIPIPLEDTGEKHVSTRS